MKILRGVAIALFPILATGGCRGCFCTNAAKSITEKPPEDVVLDGAKKGVESPSTLRTLCGVRVAGLRDLTLTIVETLGAQHKVRVSGVAIPSDGGPVHDPDDDGEDEDASTSEDASDAQVTTPAIVVDPKKALVCTGIVLVTVTAVLDTDGTRKGWDSTGFAIDSVLTPGVVYDKANAPTPGRSHRRRHHHHH